MDLWYISIGPYNALRAANPIRQTDTGVNTVLTGDRGVSVSALCAHKHPCKRSATILFHQLKRICNNVHIAAVLVITALLAMIAFTLHRQLILRGSSIPSFK